MVSVISSITAEYRRYKGLGEAAIAQLDDADFAHVAANGDNSIAVIVWHVAGNLKSRFTDFRTTDGEKPWRNRDEEFVDRTVTRQQLLEKWEDGWQVLFAALGDLRDEDLNAPVTIRNQSFAIIEALQRSLAHTAYHVGQIVFVAKSLRGENWDSLSIPRGQSAAAIANPRQQSPEQHAEELRRRAART